MVSRDSISKAKIRQKAAAKSDKPVIVIPAKSDRELRKKHFSSRQHTKK